MEGTDGRVGRAILALTSATSGNTWFVGRRTPLDRFLHLLRCLQLAVDAESQRLPRRADFYWRHALRQLALVWPDDKLWNEVAQQPALRDLARDRGIGGQELRAIVARELFADSAWALHEALQMDDEGKARSIHLLGHVRRLIDRTGALDDRRMAALAAATRDQVRSCAEAQRWDAAEALASWLLDRFASEEHEMLLAAMIRARVVSQLKDTDDERTSRADAARLAGAIARITQLQARAPRNAMLFDVLADLHLRAAVKCANGGSVAEALVAAQKSLTYDPGLQSAKDVRDRLVEMMQQRRQDAEAIQAKLASSGHASLTPKGREMIRDAGIGFSTVNAFIESAEAADTSRKLRIAQGASIWRSIGFPLGEASDEQVTVLYRALGVALEHAAGDAARASAGWRQAITEIPAAAALDESRVVAWIERRIANPSPDAPPQAAAEWPSAPSVPAITRGRRYLNQEPFTHWLFSPEALPLKAVCAATLLLLALSAGMFVRDALNRRERDAALEGLRAARAAGEYVGVLDAAEAYFSHPISAPDLRDAEVEAAYSEALVRWFTETNAGADTDGRAARYRALMLARTGGGSRQ